MYLKTDIKKTLMPGSLSPKDSDLIGLDGDLASICIKNLTYNSVGQTGLVL